MLRKILFCKNLPAAAPRLSLTAQRKPIKFNNASIERLIQRIEKAKKCRLDFSEICAKPNDGFFRRRRRHGAK
ncbi:hypothetical protein [Serratia ficaria]|uniref:hypothetical protein n=1 Tax=Serratia ficaria TaxID=61651 RepID=UPI0021BB406A|nr:hypothetical protein [Serratia ficaria]